MNVVQYAPPAQGILLTNQTQSANIGGHISNLWSESGQAVIQAQMAGYMTGQTTAIFQAQRAGYVTNSTATTVTATGDIANWINQISVTQHNSTSITSWNIIGGQNVYVTSNVTNGYVPTGQTVSMLDWNLQLRRNRLRANWREARRSRGYSPNRSSEQEQRAQELLRDMLSERDWRRYCTNGFIMVRGDSGSWYQVFASGQRTKVYNQGRYTHSICIHTDNSCPATDHVINMKTLIEIDEESVWQGGNVQSHGPGEHALFANQHNGAVLNGTIVQGVLVG